MQYTIRGGDTLSHIAQRHLGDGGLWPAIYNHADNAQRIEVRQRQCGERTRREFGLYGPNWIFPGTVIELPARL